MRAGYNIERWERPLGELAATAGPDTVVIFAQPFTRETEDFKAVQRILARGGRVLATGFWGGYLVPGGRGRDAKGIHLLRLPARARGLGFPGKQR